MSNNHVEDDWEQIDASPKLNPKAATFTPTLNPTAAVWVPPGYQASPPPARPTQSPSPPPPPPPPPAAEEPGPTYVEPPSEGSQPIVDQAEPLSSEVEQLTVSSIPEEPKAPSPAKAEAPPPPAPPAPSAPPPSTAEFISEEPPADTDEGVLLQAYKALQAEDPRDHLNIVFIGHVDAGKSTLGGQILFITGGVDKRTIEKYEREAKEKNRESWYMAYIMDTNEEERTKGITVEVGRAHFETDKKRYTILDAPGHKNYVPNMIMGAAQADVAVLVISSRKGEFETGFEKGGQTREHAQLAKTLGVVRLIVVVNKLDDPTVALPGGAWDKNRYDEIVKGLTPFLKSCGYNTKKDVTFIPISALHGANIQRKPRPDECDWYNDITLFEALDNIQPLERDPLAPFRMPIMDKYKDMGTMVMGKSEAGLVRVGDFLMMMPNRARVKVEAIYRDEKESTAAKAGENLRLRISGVDDSDVTPGFVLSSTKSLVPVVTQFEAELFIVELLEHNAIFTVGYRSVLHIHTVVEECEVTKLIAQIDPRTKEQKKVKYMKTGGLCSCRIQLEKPICIETFKDLAAMGRFTLRDEGRTIAIGKVTKLPKVH